ncbi:(2Fe-2S)-binding protein [Zobellia galactanivorans]|uniref:2Fe-2S ferredoxin-type domain-containing protein n=1 Tax=Zobellia galactanivorans (strain DSM 12802 / CCUG 47099 / CIP 106680 / NCIMB 13871 / Dsij) TaxID=63186 RepID=G0L145_ZOBGA|nr:hypothetical protein [Zobellia galactanivorans]MBU3024157.1 hypothetical protein [Zobellia galactanivorans]CAZ97633.1 Conserved hypothetical protein [Zobellia galactanivorans]
MTLEFKLNNEERSVDLTDENTPLLWVIRDIIGLKGTKFRCGKGGLC